MRELGGLPAADGKITRKGVFYRAENLARLNPEGVKTVQGLGLKTVLDLRNTGEIGREPDPFQSGEKITYVNIDMIGKAVPTAVAADGAYRINNPDGTAVFPVYNMVREYCHWLEVRVPQICRIMTELAEPDAVPLVFHCAGGKDRTGIITALLLSLAGVSNLIIAADYSHTAQNSITTYLSEVQPGANETVRNAGDYKREFCPPEVILVMLFWLDTKYGGTKPYLRSIGVSEQAIMRLKETLTG